MSVRMAVLIEYDMPEDHDHVDDALALMMETLRKTTPVPPINVTVFSGEFANRVIDAGHGLHRLDDTGGV